MPHYRQHRSRAALTIIAGAAILAVGLAPVSGATAQSQGGSAAAKHHATKKAPPAITAIALFHRTALKKALGLTISRVQDDGGVAQYDGSFASSAEVATKLTILTATLTSYPNRKAAFAAFQAGRYAGTKRIKGVGTRAYSAGDHVVVQTGDQLMIDQARPSAAGEDYLATQEKSSAAIDLVVNTPALKSGTALGKKVIGKWKVASYSELPKGAAPPCGRPNKKYGITTPTVSLSESPPFQQCDFTVGGSPFERQTYTLGQARTSLSKLTPDQAYAAELAQTDGRKVKQATFTVGRIQIKIFMVLDDDWEFGSLITERPPVHSAATLAPAIHFGDLPPAYVALLLNTYTFKMKLKQCVDLDVAYTGPGDLPPPGYGSALHEYHLAQVKARQKSTEWCQDWLLSKQK